ncbi:histidine kinase [Pseudotenacibaculum haliotis]|uniref:Histidine kinase n=1 Tax=Pseudotenacibaculum haliotis TaxID=1862138 RepID=A0ABW5LTT6_9FLAO
MKLFLFISLLFNLQSVNNIPEYSGKTIDLSTLNIATLSKGSTKDFIEDQLNAEGVYKIVSKEKGLWYLTLSFNIRQQRINNEDIWLQFRTNINAANFYLNNKLLFNNGEVNGFSKTNVDGKSLVRKRIPKEYLVDGLNKIEIEFTNYKKQTGAIFRDISIGHLESFQKDTLIMTTAPILFFGVFAFFLLINFVLYFSLNRKKVFLLLALLFFVNSLLVAYEVLYWNGFASSSSFVFSYPFRSGLEHLSYFILSIILFFEYEYEKKIVSLSILTFFLAYILAFLTDINIAITLSIFPLALSLFALFKRKKNAIKITIALFTLFILNYLDDQNTIEGYDFVHSNFIVTSLVYKLDNLGMIIFALVMIFISAKGILSKTKSLNEANLKLERLEYQFLKKLILPHFMVNTLMSLQQLVSKEPETASKMIEALSEEFHLLSKMSQKKFIPISQEIEMCETHLKIMSIQQKANYKMEVHGILGNEMIPPTIFHTLVENGITHGYSGDQNARFVLGKKETVNSIIYRLFNNSNIKISNLSHASGTGQKYVETRLEECYPGKWRLHSNRVDNGWESIIEIKHNL